MEKDTNKKGSKEAFIIISFLLSCGIFIPIITIFIVKGNRPVYHDYVIEEDNHFIHVVYQTKPTVDLVHIICSKKKPKHYIIDNDLHMVPPDEISFNYYALPRGLYYKEKFDDFKIFTPADNLLKKVRRFNRKSFCFLIDKDKLIDLKKVRKPEKYQSKADFIKSGTYSDIKFYLTTP